MHKYTQPTRTYATHSCTNKLSPTTTLMKNPMMTAVSEEAKTNTNTCRPPTPKDTRVVYLLSKKMWKQKTGSCVCVCAHTCSHVCNDDICGGIMHDSLASCKLTCGGCLCFFWCMYVHACRHSRVHVFLICVCGICIQVWRTFIHPTWHTHSDDTPLGPDISDEHDSWHTSEEPRYVRICTYMHTRTHSAAYATYIYVCMVHVSVFSYMFIKHMCVHECI